MKLYEFLTPIHESTPVTVCLYMYNIKFESRHSAGFDWPSEIGSMKIEKVFISDNGLYIRLKS